MACELASSRRCVFTTAAIKESPGVLFSVPGTVVTAAGTFVPVYERAVIRLKTSCNFLSILLHTISADNCWYSVASIVVPSTSSLLIHCTIKLLFSVVAGSVLGHLHEVMTIGGR